MAETKINGRTFRTSMLPASKAIELYAEVMGFLGPAAGQLPYILYTAKENGEEAIMLTDAALIGAFGAIVQHRGAAAVKDLATKVVGMAEILRPSGDYTEVDLDADLSDDPSEAITLALFVLREQFRPFTKGGGGSGIFQMMAKAFRPKN